MVIYMATKARDNKNIREYKRSHRDLSDPVSCKRPRICIDPAVGCFYRLFEVCVISFALRGTLDPLHLIMINNFLWANNYMHLARSIELL